MIAYKSKTSFCLQIFFVLFIGHKTVSENHILGEIKLPVSCIVKRGLKNTGRGNRSESNVISFCCDWFSCMRGSKTKKKTIITWRQNVTSTGHISKFAADFVMLVERPYLGALGAL
ncbi:hypothetical protein ACOSP7_004399 [Xanthoceras sorbifolium]